MHILPREGSVVNGICNHADGKRDGFPSFARGLSELGRGGHEETQRLSSQQRSGCKQVDTEYSWRNVKRRGKDGTIAGDKRISGVGSIVRLLAVSVGGNDA